MRYMPLILIVLGVFAFALGVLAYLASLLALDPEDAVPLAWIGLPLGIGVATFALGLQIGRGRTSR